MLQLQSNLLRADQVGIACCRPWIANPAYGKTCFLPLCFALVSFLHTVPGVLHEGHSWHPRTALECGHHAEGALSHVCSPS